MNAASPRFASSLLSLACLIASALAALPAAAAPMMGCLIEPDRVTDIGTPVVGVVQRIDVERGQRVTKGQVLAVLNAPVERASLNVANVRAGSSAELQAATAAATFNRDRLARAEGLFRQKFISQQALDQARSEAALAEQKLVQASEQRQVWRQERDVAAASLSQRVIRSPMDGLVTERFVTPGERVDEKPLLRLVKVDPLRVQLVVPVAMYPQVQLGGSAMVHPDLPGARAVPGRITMVDGVIDPASNTFRVHLELPNPDGALPAGLRCKAAFNAAPAGAPTLMPVRTGTRSPGVRPVSQPVSPPTSRPLSRRDYS